MSLLNENAFTVMSNENPYQPGSTIGQPQGGETPAWRRILGTLLRILGGLVITIPVLVLAIELLFADSRQFMNDLPVIATALCCYLGLGALLIFSGYKLSGRRRRSERLHSAPRQQ